MAIKVLRQLSGEVEITEYAECYERASGYRVPLDYLRRSTVYGLRRHGRLIGGVVMSATPPFRTLDRIPDHVRPGVEARIRADDTVDLACVWLDRSIRSGALSALFWFGLFLETSHHGVRNVMFGTESPGLHRLYLYGHPEVLYEGPVVVDGKALDGWIFLSPVSHRWPALTRMTVYKTVRDARRVFWRRPAPSGRATLSAARQHEADSSAGTELAQ